MDTGVDLSRFGLRERPFKPTTDPRFLWLGPRQKEILRTLRRAILQHHGVLLLTGDVGTGKTLLAAALAESVGGSSTLVGQLTYQRFEPLDFWTSIAETFNLPTTISSTDAFLTEFGGFLEEARTSGRSVLLIIDEAQGLTKELLAELERLAAMDESGRFRLSILLVGEDALNGVLAEPAHAALATRITTRCRLVPLNASEVGEYIEYRLAVAGAERNIFTPEAIETIAAFSGGLPRLIDTVGDAALLQAMRRGARIVDLEVVEESVSKLVSPAGGNAGVRPFPSPSRPGWRHRARLARRARHATVAAACLLAVIGGYLGARYLFDRIGVGVEATAPVPAPPAATGGSGLDPAAAASGATAPATSSGATAPATSSKSRGESGPLPDEDSGSAVSARPPAPVTQDVPTTFWRPIQNGPGETAGSGATAQRERREDVPAASSPTTTRPGFIQAPSPRKPVQPPRPSSAVGEPKPWKPALDAAAPPPRGVETRPPLQRANEDRRSGDPPRTADEGVRVPSVLRPPVQGQERRREGQETPQPSLQRSGPPRTGVAGEPRAADRDPESDRAREREPDPSGIIDWLLKERPR